ncbi:MAG: VOC family protein [Methanoregula sp.]|nr:VOC family protein [Methanoregula sp.]
MKIIITSVFVNDQERALRFYTNVMGFVKKQDVTAGEYRWLTVVSPDQPDGTELLLEPNANPAAQMFQQAIFKEGIPATMFGVGNIWEEYQRLKALGVVFTVEPEQVMGPVMRAVLDDTCGNLIQIVQK